MRGFITAVTAGCVAASALLSVSVATAAPAGKAKSKVRNQSTSGQSSAGDASSSVNSSANSSLIPAPQEAAAVTTSGGASTASMSEVVKEKPRRFKGEFSSWNEVGVASFKDGKNEAVANNYLGVSLKIDDNQSLSVRQQFDINYANNAEQRESEAHIEDIYLNYTNAKVVGWGNPSREGSLIFVGRAYLPTGETSRFVTKTNGSVLGWGIVSQKVAKAVALNYHAQGAWFNQSQDTYADSSGALKGTKDYQLTQFGEASWDVTKWANLAQALGTKKVWRRSDIGQGVDPARANTAIASTTLTFVLPASVSLSAGLSNEVDIYRPKRKYKLYRDDESTYFLALSATI